MAFDINAYQKILQNPYHTRSSDWSHWKAGYQKWSKNQLAGLNTIELRFKQQYDRFASQAAGQLAQARQQLKDAVDDDALRRGLSYSTIPGTEIGSEDARLEGQYRKVDNDAKASLSKALSDVGSAKRGVEQMNKATGQIDRAFARTKPVDTAALAALAAIPVDYGILTRMRMAGAPEEAIALKKKQLDSQKAAQDAAKQAYGPRQVAGYDENLKKFLKGAAKAGTADTLANRNYYNNLRVFNALVDSIQYNFNRDQQSNHKAYEAISKAATPDVAKSIFHGDPANKKLDLTGEVQRIRTNKDVSAYLQKTAVAYEADRKREEDAKSQLESDYARLTGLSAVPAEQIRVPNADWGKLGYSYGTDADDQRRKELGLPPASAMKLYDSLAGKERLKAGLMPETVLNTEKAVQDASSFQQEETKLYQSGTATPEAIDALYDKYPRLKAIDQRARNEKFAQTLQGKTNVPHDVSDAINQNRLSNSYVMDLLSKAGFQTGTGFSGLKDAAAVDISSQPGTQPGTNYAQQYNRIKPALMDQYETILKEKVREAAANGEFGDWSQYYLAMLDKGYTLYQLNPDRMNDNPYVTGEDKVLLTDSWGKPIENRDILFTWAKALELNPEEYPQSDTMLKLVYIGKNRPSEKDSVILKKGEQAPENKLTTNPLYGMTSADLSSTEAGVQNINVGLRGSNLPYYGGFILPAGHSIQDYGFTMLTKEEKDLINYYYGLDEEETANQLLHQYQNQHARELSLSNAQWLMDVLSTKPSDDFWTRAAKKTAGVADSMAGFVPATSYALETLLYGTTRPGLPLPETNSSMQLRLTQAAHDSVSKGMSPTARFFTDLGVNLADSAPYLLMGEAAPWVMGASAMGQASLAAKDRGATGLQSLMEGLAQGATMTLLGKATVGKLARMEPLPLDVAKGFTKEYLGALAKAAGKEALTGFGVGFATHITNMLSDAVIMGAMGQGKTKSQIQELYEQRYRESGNQVDAAVSTFFNIFGQAVESGAQNAIMSAVFGAARALGTPSTETKIPQSIGQDGRVLSGRQARGVTEALGYVPEGRVYVETDGLNRVVRIEPVDIGLGQGYYTAKAGNVGRVYEPVRGSRMLLLQ